MIKKEQILISLSYIVVGGLSILFAFWLSTSLLSPSRSQQPGVVPEDPALTEMPDSDPLEQDSANTSGVQVELQSFLEPFIYDPKGRRDPFKPYTEVQVGEDGEVPVGPVLPLQRFDLAELKLIGIMWNVQEPKAMFLDPNSRIYTIGKDERIGRNNGYVAAIREGEVVVVETFKRREGETLYTPRVIRMER